MTSRYFPVLPSLRSDDEKELRKLHAPTRVSWDLVAPHEAQAFQNHDQSLERLAERRGLCAQELVAVLEDRRYRDMTNAEAVARLRELQVLPLEAAPTGRRLIVCGGRKYENRDRIYEVLDVLDPTEIAHGGATGADFLADRWWWIRRTGPSRTYPADWTKHGKPAGPIRNREMFGHFLPDGVAAFPGGNGTADMVEVGLRGGAWIVKVDW